MGGAMRMHLARTFATLRRRVTSIRREYRLSDERREAFPFWFCQAMLAHPDDEAAIRRALVGKKNDRNVDVLFVDDVASVIYLCQTKYHDKLSQNTESPNDVTAVAHVAADFVKPKAEFLRTFKNAAEDVVGRLLNAWDLVRSQKYAVRAFFVTTGKVSKATREEAEAIVHDLALPNGRALDVEYMVFDGPDCCRLQVDYEDLVPAIPYIDLTDISDWVRIGDSGDEGLYAYLFSVPTGQLRSIYNKHRERLFARNIRLSKGDKSRTNQEIKTSLADYPAEFFFLNNGITVLGTAAEPRGNKVLRVFSPQIINGQQTTRVIAKHQHHSEDSSVLVRVIARTVKSDPEVDELQRFVQRVVRATNFQNPIKLSELAANRPEHIRIERAFRNLQWQYVRKRGIREDVQRFTWVGAYRPYGKVTLQELTTALVACLHDPQYIRVNGIEEIFEGLFEEEHEGIYGKLFRPDRDANDYLFCVLCYRLAADSLTPSGTLRRSVENHGKYFIARRIHESLVPLYGRESLKRSLLRGLGAESYRVKYPQELKQLRRAVGEGWDLFFRRHGGDDIRTFVSDAATKQAWHAFFSKAHANTGPRHRLTAAVESLRRRLLAEL